ncbi:MAG TPA: F0F1 ATP synthase subunit delta [Candidatus Paceibacterota bacterium]|nr:F0F1 ATP synthase subunit delta [Candidatus Paceibacterota bacterium]
MKYAPHVYAKALVEVLSDTKSTGAKDDAVIAKNFIALVKKNGDEAHLKKILEEASRFARGKSGVRKVAIESARALQPSQRKAVEHFIKPGDVVEERIDTELVAGIKIILNDELQFDGSLKHKLDRMLGSV